MSDAAVGTGWTSNLTRWAAALALLVGAVQIAMMSGSGPSSEPAPDVGPVALLSAAFCVFAAVAILRRSPLAVLAPGCAVAMAAVLQWASYTGLVAVAVLGVCAVVAAVSCIRVVGLAVRQHAERGPAEWIAWAALPVVTTCSLATWSGSFTLHEGAGPALGAVYCAGLTLRSWWRIGVMASVAGLTVWLAVASAESILSDQASWHPALAAAAIVGAITCDLRWWRPEWSGRSQALVATVVLVPVAFAVTVSAVHRSARHDGLQEGRTEGRLRAERIAAAEQQRRREAAERQLEAVDPERQRPGDPRTDHTEAECRDSEDCADRGNCGRHWSGYCQPASDDDCRRSRVCQEHGLCKRLEYGSAEVAYCGPGRDADCRSSPACGTSGACATYTVKGVAKCGPPDPASCEASLMCRVGGYCTLGVTAEGFRHCGPASEQACRDSPMCRVLGLCSVGVVEGAMRCVAKTERDCRDSVLCRELSMCSVIQRGELKVCGAVGL